MCKVRIASLRYPKEGRDLVLRPASYREVVEASGANLDNLVGRRSVPGNVPSRPLPNCGYGTMAQASETRPPAPPGNNTRLSQTMPNNVGRPVQESWAPDPARSTPSGRGLQTEYHHTGRRTLWRCDWGSARKYLGHSCPILGLLICTPILLSLFYGIYLAGVAVVGYIETSWHYLASLVEKLIKMIRGWISF